MKTDTIEAILKVLTDSENFLIAGHFQPDPDCLCSQWSLAEFLKRKGKKVTLANAGPMTRDDFEPFRQLFYESLESILPQIQSEKPVLIVVDCSSGDRIGSLQKSTENLRTVVIDHHANGDENFGDIRYIDPTSPSTTLLIKRILCAWDQSLLTAVADNLFWGFCTDSGFFRFLQKGCAPWLRDVADLVEAGAVPSRTYAKMMFGKSLLSRRFTAEMVRKMKVLENGRFFLATVTKAIEKRYGDEKDTSSFYDAVMAVKGCEIIALIKYEGRRHYSVSLRSVRIDVGKTALSYGGGGHKLAAGFRFKGSLFALKRQLKQDIACLLKKETSL